VLVNSSGQGVSALGFRYIDGRTVEWIVPALTGDKYLISVDAAMLGGIADLALDGEWDTSATTWAQGSGNGAAGGSFNFRFNVLPGDFDSSGSVAFGELGQARLKLGQNTSSSTYLYRQDYDGSGSMTFGDFGQARGRLGTGISAFADPVNPPDSLEFQHAYDRDIIAEPRNIVQEYVPQVAMTVDPEEFHVGPPGLDSGADVAFAFVEPVFDFFVAEAPTASDGFIFAVFASDEFAEPTFTATPNRIETPQFVAAPIFLEPAAVVGRTFSPPLASPSDAAGIAVRPATYDLWGSRFERTVALGGTALAVVRPQAWTSLRSEARPNARPRHPRSGNRRPRYRHRCGGRAGSGKSADCRTASRVEPPAASAEHGGSRRPVRFPRRRPRRFGRVVSLVPPSVPVL